MIWKNGRFLCTFTILSNAEFKHHYKVRLSSSTYMFNFIGNPAILFSPPLFNDYPFKLPGDGSG